MFLNIIIGFRDRLARLAPTAAHHRKFPLKENQNLLTPFAIFRFGLVRSQPAKFWFKALPIAPASQKLTSTPASRAKVPAKTHSGIMKQRLGTGGQGAAGCSIKSTFR
jgi:hypothetical protein